MAADRPWRRVFPWPGLHAGAAPQKKVAALQDFHGRAVAVHFAGVFRARGGEIAQIRLGDNPKKDCGWRFPGHGGGAFDHFRGDWRFRRGPVSQTNQSYGGAAGERRFSVVRGRLPPDSAWTCERLSRSARRCPTPRPGARRCWGLRP